MARFGSLRLGTAITLIGTFSFSAAAESEVDKESSKDSYDLYGQVQSNLLLFRTAPVPGPSGAVVRTDTKVPFVEYLNLQASRLDTSLGKDTCDVELSLWWGAELGDPGYTDRLQGDVQTAAVTLRTTSEARRAWVKLGRQVQAGGAARFARFDGVSAGVALVPQLTLAAYGGLLVLPRWNQRPGYYHLGSAADSLLSSPEAFEQAGRGEYAVAGGRMSFDDESFHAALSFHEQRDQGQLGRRNLGLDAGAPLAEYGFAGASMILDLDALRLSTARLFADFWLGKRFDLGVEYLKADPSLLMSHQSVLSVFGTSAYQETGGSMGVRPIRLLRLTASGYVQFYEEGSPGSRFDAGARLATSTAPGATVLYAGYGRVDADEVGYSSGRVAVNQPFPHGVTATFQGYAYFYDKEIEGYKSSLMGNLSVAYAFAKQWQLLWAGTVGQSPYASMDANTQLRLTYQFAVSDQGDRW